MSTTATHLKILLLAKRGLACDAIAARLGNEADVRLVESLDEAMAALRAETYDLVISEQGDFNTLQQGVVDQQATTILNSIGQGICIFNVEGQQVWANPTMQSFPEELTAQISDVCIRTFGEGDVSNKSSPAHSRSRRFSLTAHDDQYFEVTLTPVFDHHGELTQFTAVVWDVTHSRRLQKKIDAIDLAGREIVRMDEETTAGMNVEERINLLEQKMMRYMHELLNYDNFAVLLIDKKSDRLEIVLEQGMSEQTRELDLYSSPENNGISGYVASTGRSYICHDTSKDPRYLQGLKTAKSSLTVPLRLHDHLIGVFNIESDHLNTFNEDDRQFAEILARYVALALHMLDLLVTERYESTGRIADDVIDEIAGPLNDIMTEAGFLKEEYIGNEDLRHRLSIIMDNVGDIKSKVRAVTAPNVGILGRRNKPGFTDPLLDGKRILIADDEEIIRETIGGVLKKLGCEVEVALDGAQAIELLRQNAYDLVLADIKMPHHSGYEVFASAQDLHPNCGVILMTGFGYDPNHSIVRARKEGLSAVLFKPFKVDQLLSEIRQSLQPAG